MVFTEKMLVCRDCGEEFAFTVGEQEFYAEKGFQNEPKRCLDCRRNRKREKRGGGGNSRRAFHTVVCAECGQETQVPFEPKEGRPVYCRDCFEVRR